MGIIRRFNKNDLKEFTKLIEEKEDSKVNCDNYLKQVIAGYDKQDWEHEIAICNENNKVIGSIYLEQNGKDNYILGIYILKEYRSKGFGFKALKSLLGNTEFGIECSVYKDNTHSNNLIEKIKYTEKRDDGGEIYSYTIRECKELDMEDF